MTFINVRMDNVWAYPDDHHAVIKAALSYRPQGYVFNRAYKAGYWDGKSSMFDGQAKRFPAGLVDYTRDFCRAKGYTLEVQDDREIWRQASRAAEGWAESQRVLEPAQQEAVDTGLEVGRGVIHFPTAAGKTTIMGDIVRQLGCQTLILCNSTDLMTQLQAELSTVVGATVGTYGGGSDKRRDITVATVQTLASQWPEEWLANIGCVCVDEAHHLQADSYARVMQALTGAYYRYAFSATPFRSRNAVGAADRATYLQVVGWTGEVIARQTKAEAVESGRLVPAAIFVVDLGADPTEGDVDADYGKKDQWGNPWAYSPMNPARRNYSEDVDDYLIHNKVRNDCIFNIAYGMARRKQQVVILLEREEHGLILSARLGAPFLYGKTKKAEREAQFEAFRNGKVKCLIVSKIGDEGLNLPNLDVLILAGAGRAAHRQIQRIGRGLRVSPGKTHLNVFEFADKGKYLSQQYRRRRRTYEVEPIFTVADVTKEELEEWLKT